MSLVLLLTVLGLVRTTQTPDEPRSAARCVSVHIDSPLARSHLSLSSSPRYQGDEAERQTSVREGRELNKGRLLRTLVSKRTVDAPEMKSKAKKSLLQVQKTHGIIKPAGCRARKRLVANKWRSRRGAFKMCMGVTCRKSADYFELSSALIAFHLSDLDRA